MLPPRKLKLLTNQRSGINGLKKSEGHERLFFFIKVYFLYHKFILDKCFSHKILLAVIKYEQKLS